MVWVLVSVGASDCDTERDRRDPDSETSRDHDSLIVSGMLSDAEREAVTFSVKDMIVKFSIETLRVSDLFPVDVSEAEAARSARAAGECVVPDTESEML
jgi:hypothetical protein